MKGWICENCMCLNMGDNLCQNCGLQRSWQYKPQKLYKLQGHWRTAKEHANLFDISLTAVRKHAVDSK